MPHALVVVLVAVAALAAACGGEDEQLRENLDRAQERAREAERRADLAEERIDELEARLEDDTDDEPADGPEQDEAKIGDTVALDGGHEATVYEVQRPAQPNRRMTLEPEPGNEHVAVDADFCTDQAAATPVRIGQSDFRLRDADGGRWEFWNVQDYARDPRFPTSEEVGPGDCVRGWITYEIAQDIDLTAVELNTRDPDLSSAEWLVD